MFIAQFIVYKWFAAQHHNINNYLDKIKRETRIVVDLARIFGKESCTNFFHVLNFNFEKPIFHKNLSFLFSKYPYVHVGCHNPSLGFATKARACKNAGQEGSPGVTFHAPGSAKECEGMNPHTPKGTPTLGVGVPVDSQIFREQLQGSKLIGLKCSLYHWKALGM
jgi:hypothetical protein